MTLVIRSRSKLDPGENEVEVVERKGRGHPDTICDALSEEVSRTLCRYYLERFGRILHHNVDKVLLVGGSSKPRLAAARSLGRSKSSSPVARQRSGLDA